MSEINYRTDVNYQPTDIHEGLINAAQIVYTVPGLWRHFVYTAVNYGWADGSPRSLTERPPD